MAERAFAPWFDMANCSFCKHIVAEEGLMENMTKTLDGHPAATIRDPGIGQHD